MLLKKLTTLALQHGKYRQSDFHLSQLLFRYFFKTTNKLLKPNYFIIITLQKMVHVVYFLVDLLMDGEILKDLENTLIYDAMVLFTQLTDLYLNRGKPLNDVSLLIAIHYSATL